MGSKSISTTLFTIFMLLALIGCGGTEPVENTNGPDSSSGAFDQPSPYGSVVGWPDYIPDDIPELEGEIDIVMNAPNRIRIFYNSVTDKQVERYLKRLDRSGFELEYLVYVQEGFPDNSEERLKRGEFDAVDITKGEYQMRLEAGGGQATYDIYTNGFEDAVPEDASWIEGVELTPPTAVPVQWPEAVDGVVPPPEGGELVNVLSISPGEYMISCQFDQSEAVQAYIQTLQADGFSEQDKLEDGNGNLISITLEKEGTAVTILGGAATAVSIQIKLANP
jgi:hypothetical protein